MIKKEDGKRVLDFIRTQMGVELPQAGLLAGQSITSILLYLYGKSNTIEVNDYDIFMPVECRRGSWSFRPETWALAGHSSFFKVSRYSDSMPLSKLPDFNLVLEDIKQALPTSNNLMKRARELAWHRNDKRLNRIVTSNNILESVESLTLDDAKAIYAAQDDYVMEYENKSAFNRKNRLTFSRPTNNHGDGYSIQQVFRKGLLNYVFVSSRTKDRMTPHPHLILHYFDLNCVQVAIDLRTQEIYFTRYFEHFMHSQQMILLRADRPYHSIIRYFQKKEQHGYYGNDELSVGMVNTMLCLKNLKEDDPLVLMETSPESYKMKVSEFGDGYADKFKSSHLIKPFYKIESRTVKVNRDENSNCDRQTYHLNHLKGKDEGLSYILSGKHRQHLEKLLGLQICNYPYYAISSLPSICHEHFGVFSAQHRNKKYSLLKGHKFNTRTECSSTIKDLLYASPDHFAGNLVDEHVRAVNTYLTRHPHLAKQMLMMSMEKKYQLILKLKSIEKKDFNFSTFLDGALYIDFNNMDSDDFAEEIQRQKDEYILHISTLNKLKDEADLPSLEMNGVHIKELITQGQLEEEHRTVRHCVNGYGHSVKSRRSFIVSFRSENEMATLELVQGYDKKYRKMQFRGIMNREPSKSMNQTMKEYVEFVNEQVELLKQA
ncbi:hypothetical protein D3C87_936840 [compost metagenome]